MTLDDLFKVFWIIYGGIGTLCVVGIAGAVCKLLMALKKLCEEKGVMVNESNS